MIHQTGTQAWGFIAAVPGFLPPWEPILGGLEVLKEITVPSVVERRQAPGKPAKGVTPGRLWTQLQHLTSWIGKVDVGQIQILSRVYHLLEYTGSKAKMAAQIAKTVRRATDEDELHEFLPSFRGLHQAFIADAGPKGCGGMPRGSHRRLGENPGETSQENASGYAAMARLP
eukprot:symbB.v1.2.005018.t1/scaffold288.1/size478366/48